MILDRELDRMNLSDVNLEQLAKKLNVEDAEELYFKMVDGSIKPGRAAAVAQRMLKPSILSDEEQLEITFKNNRAANDDKKPTDMAINGVTDILTTLAKCCQPVPGDNVLGFVTRGTGITIHREECPNILYQKHEALERVVEVNWGQNEERVYPMTVLISAFDRKGLLRDVSTVFADEKVNVLEMKTRTDAKNQSVLMESLFEVTSFEAMSRLLAKLDHLPNVLSVKRKT